MLMKTKGLASFSSKSVNIAENKGVASDARCGAENHRP
jgi:hypothetical protein